MDDVVEGVGGLVFPAQAELISACGPDCSYTNVSPMCIGTGGGISQNLWYPVERILRLNRGMLSGEG